MAAYYQPATQPFAQPAFTKPKPKTQFPKVTFRCNEVLTRLTAMKAKAGGEGFWWAPQGERPAFRITFDSVNSKGNAKYADVYYCDGAGVEARFNLRVGKYSPDTESEVHTGPIGPKSEQAVAEINAGISDPRFHVIKREGDPNLKVNKYNVRVKTEADGVTIPTDEAGEPVLPGNEHLSQLYAVASLVNEVFAAECAARIARGAALFEAALTSTTDKGGQVKYQRRADTTVSALVAAHPSKGMFLTLDQVQHLRLAYKAEVNALTANAVVNELKINSVVREFFGATGPKAGELRPNPVLDVKIRADDVDLFSASIYDLDTLSHIGGQTCEMLRVDGVPVNGENVHRGIISGTTFDGFVKFDTVCFHKQGISWLREVLMLWVKRPNVAVQSDFELMYGDMMPAAAMTLSDAAAPATAAALATAAPAAAAVARPAALPAAPPADEYDDLLNEMGADA
jgi:hypothetical protein